MAVCRADGTKPPATGELFDLNGTAGLSEIKASEGVSTSVAELNGAGMIKIDFSKLEGYPGIDFPIPAGGWDLSGFTGVKIEVNNSGAVPVNVNLKVSNEGDWKLSPWSVDAITVNPGQAQTLKVVFGEAFHHPAFKLDPAHVVALRLFVLPPKGPASILVGAPTLFKEESPAAVAPASAPVAEAPAAAPPPPPPPPVQEEPVFPPTPLLDIAGKHDFPTETTITDDASTQLKDLCSLAEFRALPEGDRHVYSFDVWSGDKSSLGAKSYAFNFHLGTEGVTNQKSGLSSRWWRAGWQPICSWPFHGSPFPNRRTLNGFEISIGAGQSLTPLNSINPSLPSGWS